MKKPDRATERRQSAGVCALYIVQSVAHHDGGVRLRAQRFQRVGDDVRLAHPRFVQRRAADGIKAGVQ